MNESSEEQTPGDVSVFRSIGGAMQWLEPWWFAEGHGTILTASGERLSMRESPRGYVELDRCEPDAEGERLVREWLHHKAKAILQVRRERAVKGRAILASHEKSGLLPSTVEGLIAYVGFDD
ncbi:hypothetical protein SCD90_09420 [Terrihabitans sp. PJ23]|uniref:Uncharacterized protein n=1 Tax=Terrihabitans rhizophilus TaxID=3092662 RepID=A0ABU4RN71_9HYPH|nr:hypothetical protein [Terrihabitans sp. PJ23]